MARAERTSAGILRYNLIPDKIAWTFGTVS